MERMDFCKGCGRMGSVWHRTGLCDECTEPEPCVDEDGGDCGAEAPDVPANDTTVAEIAARVRATICPTFSSDGERRVEGRISAEDFNTLMRLLGGPIYGGGLH